MQRGEVRWYTFKTPDKKRPVLIQTVSKAKLGPFITALSEQQMDKVKIALLFALGF